MYLLFHLHLTESLYQLTTQNKVLTITTLHQSSDNPATTRRSSGPNNGSSSSIKCHVYHHVGGRRHTPVVCNESREPHTSHYASTPVTKKQPTNYSNQPLCSRPAEFFYSCFDIKVKKIRLYVINFFERISVAHSS